MGIVQADRALGGQVSHPRRRVARLMRMVRWFVGLLSAASIVACTGGELRDRLLNRASQPVPSTLPPRVQAALRDFDFAVRQLETSYLDAHKLDDRWRAVVSDARRQLSQASEEEVNTALFQSIASIVSPLEDDSLAVLPPAGVQTSGRFGGIGILVDLPRPGKDRVLVLSVYPDSPAERAGIKPHDAIIAVNGELVRAEDGPAVISRLRGEPGTTVTVTVRTPSRPARQRDVRITRQVIEPVVHTHYERLPDMNIGYIAPSAGDANAMFGEVAAALRRLHEAGELSGLILDLRVVRSEEFPLEEMLSLFVNGPIGSVRTSEAATGGFNPFALRRSLPTLNVRGVGIAGSQQLPLAVMVSEHTVGPVEAFVGLLQDAGRARVVGTPTPGNFARLTTITLPSSRVRLRIPSGDYIGLRNNSWRGRGVQPDVRSPLDWESFTAEDDAHLPLAIQALQPQP
ncbi:MAG: S41 family peptidase [Thermoflexales bacterium]